MSSRQMRNTLPPLYGVLVLIGFLISPVVGVIVLIGGGAVMGVMWSSLSRAAAGGPGRDRNRNRNRNR